MDHLVRLALITGQPLSELMTWEPEALQTAMVWLEEKRDAEKDAAKRRG
jgi:hypothetical protein